MKDEINKTIEAIEDLDTNPSNCILYEENSNGANYGMCDHYETGFTCAELKALAAELTKLREFVGAIVRLTIDGEDGWEQDGAFWFFDEHGEGIATGTDPFDAWRKMQEKIIGESENKS